MNKPKLKNILITKYNYLDLLKVGDKVWEDGDCQSWPYLGNIYLIEDSGRDNSTNESICKECQKKALKKRIKKLQKKLEKLQSQLEEM